MKMAVLYGIPITQMYTIPCVIFGSLIMVFKNQYVLEEMC